VSESYPQRRRFPRIASENVVLVGTADQAVEEGFARTRDLGLGGCSFVNAAPIAVGTMLDLSISLAGRVVRTTSRVVYDLPEGDAHEIGVKFLSIDPEDAELLRELFAAVESQG
jgi:c-di-GMP-binding flagellar brake protein YcgR